jgi:anion-transporting  ArsA/GET3 family ATPase
VVTGKGGVGKTTVAAALGLVAARWGLRTIVAEVARRDDVSRAFTSKSGPACGDHVAASATRKGGEGIQEEELAPGLHHVSIDPEEVMELYLADQLSSRALADVLISSRTFTYLAAATPGLRELLTVGKVWELAQEDRRTPGARPYDLVVLDAPATGHGVAVLSAPRTFAQAARVGRIARQGRTIDAMLSDPARTGVVVVARPEEMPVTETLSVEAAVHRELGLDIGLVVANGVLAQRFSAGDIRRLETAADGPEVRAARHASARARAQRAQLRRLRRGARAPIATLPFVFDGDILASLARDLERAL